MANENERAVASRLVDGLLAVGLALNIDNGSERPLLREWTVDRAQVLAVMFAGGEEEISAVESLSGGGVQLVGVVRIAYGRAADGSELVFDHSDELAEIVNAALPPRPSAPPPPPRGRRRGPKP